MAKKLIFVDLDITLPEGEDGIHIRKADKKWNDNPVYYLLKFVCSKSVGNWNKHWNKNLGRLSRIHLRILGRPRNFTKIKYA